MKKIKPHKFSIYRVIDRTNGKIYIGQTTKKNPNDRWSGHISSCNTEKNYLLCNAIRKHGAENFSFEVIGQYPPNQKLLNAMETISIIQHKSHMSTGMGYNMTWGGTTTTGYKWTEEQKLCITGENSSRWNTTQSEETRNKQSIRRTGKYCGENSPNTGLIRSEETCRLISIANAGLKRDEKFCEDVRQRMKGVCPVGAKRKGKDSPNSKIYRLYFKNGDIIEVHCLKEWCKENGYNVGTLYQVALSKRKRHKDIIKVEKLN